MNVLSPKQLVITTVLAVGLSFSQSCSFQSDSSNPEATTAQADYTDVVFTEQKLPTTGSEKVVAEINLEGMTCEMGCGTLIKNALKKVEGVQDVSIAFDAENPQDRVTVECSAKNFDAKALVGVISGIHNGQYKVKSVSATHYLADVNKSAEVRPTCLPAEPATFTVPNLFSVFSCAL